MWFYETHEQRKAREQAESEGIARILEEARKKAEARRAWEAKPPCPTCGHKEPLPIWLY